MRKLLFSLAVLAGLGAVAPASAAVSRPAVFVPPSHGPIVEAYWSHHHWVTPHRFYHHRVEHDRFRR